jgi:hypothetical protein
MIMMRLHILSVVGRYILLCLLVLCLCDEAVTH